MTQEPVLQRGQQVFKVVSVRGQNLYDLCDEHGKVQVFELPARLRHVVFVKPGMFVFGRVDSTRVEGAIKGDIEVVILDQFLSSLRKAHYWPDSFALKTPASRVVPSDPLPHAPSNSQASIDNGGDSRNDNEEHEDDDWLAAGNPNRASWARYEVSSEEDNEEEEKET